MPTIVILGLKVPFRELWEKTGTKERPACSCSTTSETFAYCPHCGVKKINKKVKVYKSRVTGDESTFRSLNPVIDYLLSDQLELYDSNPRGYSDDPVYIYFSKPNCYLEVSHTDPVSMASIQQYPYELEDWLKGTINKELWSVGEYGLWAFTVKDPAPAIISILD